jgi:hypothetical protein
MNVLLVAVLGWLAIGLEMGLKGTLSMQFGAASAAPSFVIPLAVFIALCAPAMQAVWACLILGAFLDLTAPQAIAGENITVLGPYAVGMAIACQFVLSIRGLVIRRHPLAVVMLSMIAAAIMHIVVVAFFTLRDICGDPVVWHTTQELLGRFISAGLTSITAFFIALALGPMAPLLGLPAGRGWVRR